jgi:phosphonate transport system substrate-binding protein
LTNFSCDTKESDLYANTFLPDGHYLTRRNPAAEQMFATCTREARSIAKQYKVKYFFPDRQFTGAGQRGTQKRCPLFRPPSNSFTLLSKEYTSMRTLSGKKNVFLLLFFLLLSFLISGPASAAAQEKKSIVIGLLPEMNVFKQKSRFAPLAAHLSKRLQMPVTLTMLSRYGNIIERLQEEKVDGAFLGSFTGALAISQLGVEPLARPINMDNTSTYFGYIFTKKASDIKTAADMKGKSLALVERATTAGYVFPIAWLRQHGVEDFDTHFSEYFFTGSHDAAIDAVLEGKADVGAAKNTVYEMMQKSHSRIDEELVILAKSPRVPSNGLCVRKGLPPELKKKLQTILLNLHNEPEGAAVLEKLGAKRFVQTSREDYGPVFQLAEEAGIDLKRYSYYNP